MPERLPLPPAQETIREPELPRERLREILLLSERASQAGLPVLPGNRWGFHYPDQGTQRNERLEGLVQGYYEPDQATDDLRPDAIFFDYTALTNQNSAQVQARIQTLTDQARYQNYHQLAEFAAGYRGKAIDIPELSQIYETLSGTRLQKSLLDAYGSTGRQKIETVLREESTTYNQNGFPPGPIGVAQALRVDWLCTNQLIQSEERDTLLGSLGETEQVLFARTRDAFRTYVQTGEQQAYTALTTAFQGSAPDAEPPAGKSREELKQELEPFLDQTPPPGMAGDPAIPPEDEDEYHTPPPQPEEAQTNIEQEKEKPIYTISPSGSSTQPLTGYYCSGRKSYYDAERKVWSKKKQLTSYNTALAGSERQTISGRLEPGTKSLPLPSGYAIDAASFQAEGTAAQILRDQNGCFYLQTDGAGTFRADFLKEATPFLSAPIGQDRELLPTSSLSPETEQFLASCQGDATNSALQVQNHIHRHHWYPGGGDLQMAQALQYKLREESQPDDYISNLDRSEYLECYSAANLWVALMRRLGISARLVDGHHLERVENATTAIDSTTGHAWGEFWDGATWRRVDPTPPAKPQDKKSDQQPTSPETGLPAEDGGLEGMPAQTPATPDPELADAQERQQYAEDMMNRLDSKKQELNEKVQNAKNFQDLENLRQQAGQSDLLDDMKEDLNERIENKKAEMKKGIENQLEQMTDDGFMEEAERDRLKKELDSPQGHNLDELQKKLAQEHQLFNEYEAIREEVNPLVEEWFTYFLERLPRVNDMEVDEDSLSRRGSYDRHAAMRPRNLVFGTVRNPHVIRPTVQPHFLGAWVVDTSGSMEGEKLQTARKLLVFYNELMSRLQQEFGYVRTANYAFADTLTCLKAYDQDYASNTRYQFVDGATATVKARLMRSLQATGGTNMLPAIQEAAASLNQQAIEYPDYVSAFYFVGDGDDTCGNSYNVAEFVKNTDSEKGFGRHLLSATLLGSEKDRHLLASIFGEEHTAVAGTFEEEIEISMQQFDADLCAYLEDKVS